MRFLAPTCAQMLHANEQITTARPTSLKIAQYSAETERSSSKAGFEAITFVGSELMEVEMRDLMWRKISFLISWSERGGGRRFRTKARCFSNSFSSGISSSSSSAGATAGTAVVDVVDDGSDFDLFSFSSFFFWNASRFSWRSF